MDVRLSAPLRLLAAALLFSTGGAAIKATSLTGWQVASFRSGFAALALWLMSSEARRGYSWRAVPVGAAYATTLILFVLANKLTTSANTIFLQSTAPLYLLLLSPWLLREPIRRQDLWFMGTVGLGLGIFFVGANAPMATAPDPWRGNLLAAASGGFWALTMIGLRWMSRYPGTNPALPAVVLGNVFAFAAGLLFALPLQQASAIDWGVVVYLGIFQIGLAYFLLTSALRHLPVLEAAIILLVEPVLNPIWAWLVHHERPGGWVIVGGVIILGATTVRTWLDTRSSAEMLPLDTAATVADR
jgi:drug/metabolite transporter, DME family